MKTPTLVLALLLAAAAPSIGATQTTPPAPDAAQQARNAVKAPTFDLLSPASRAKVQAVIDQVNGGTLTDLRAAVRQIDAVLTPAEAKAVLTERAKTIQALHVNQSPATAADPGRFLLNLSVSRETMRLLREQETAAKPAS
jgi:hypothetical protein